jgi:hypothetical protein
MALRYADSFEHKDQDRYLSINSTQTWPTGRRGTGAIRIQNTGAGIADWHFEAPVSITDNVLVCGFAIRLSNTTSGNLTSFRASGSNRAVFSTTSSGFQLSSFGSTINTGVSLVTGTWYFVEFKIEFDAANGYAEIRVNGETLATYSGSTNTNHSGIDSVFAGGNGSPDALIDDFYVLDGSGTTNNDFLGDIQVHYMLPTADGAVTQLHGSDGDQIDNYDNINQAIPSTNEYNGSTSIGDLDLYALTNTLSTSVSWDIHGVQVTSKVGKSAGGDAFGRLLTVEGGSTLHSSIAGLSTDYIQQFMPLDNTPSSSPWNMTNLGNLEIGFQVTGATGV